MQILLHLVELALKKGYEHDEHSHQTWVRMFFHSLEVLMPPQKADMHNETPGHNHTLSTKRHTIEYHTDNAAHSKRSTGFGLMQLQRLAGNRAVAGAIEKMHAQGVGSEQAQKNPITDVDSSPKLSPTPELSVTHKSTILLPQQAGDYLQGIFTTPTDTAFDDPHFESPGAKQTAGLFVRIVPFEFIVRMASSQVNKWNTDELYDLVSTLWQDSAPAFHSVYRGISVVKNVVSDPSHYASWHSDGQLIINQSAYTGGKTMFRMVIQHELGHGFEHAHPGTVAAFGRFLSKHRNLTTESAVKRICGEFSTQAFNSVQTNKTNPEEYFCTAYATWRVRPDRIFSEAMRAWFRKLG